MSLARRLQTASGGSGSFPARPYIASGPYPPGLSTTRLLTQLHCHTTDSDGSYSPASLVASYLAAGYQALAITDHDVATVQPAGITTAIPGVELSPSQQHIIAIDSDYSRGAVTDAQQIIDGIEADGGYSEIAHPNWSMGMTYGEMAALTGYLGIEIHNGHVISGSGQNPVTYPGYAVDRWDELLTGVRRDVWAFSVDDLHSVGAFAAYDMGRVQVFAESTSKADIVAAIVAGDFAADVANHGVTAGRPVRSNSGLYLACPGATRIEAWGSAGLLESSAGTSITHAFDGSSDYVRLVAVGGYTEAFGAALSDRWYAVDGTWTVTGGVLALSTDGTARRIILRRHRQGDFTAQVDVKLSAGGTDAAALMFNVLDANHYSIVRIGESVLASWNNQLAIGSTSNNSFSDGGELDAYAFDPAAGTWYTIKMAYTAATGTIEAKVWDRSGAEPGSWQVSASDTTWTWGAFGFRANRTCEYDNLVIDGFQTFYQPVAVDAA